MARRLALVIVALLAGMAADTGAAVEPAVRGPRVGKALPSPDLEPQLAGCALLRRGPLCEVSSGQPTLRVWLRGASRAPARFEVDGIELAARSRTPAAGGMRFEFEIPQRARVFSVEAQSQRWSWKVRSHRSFSWQLRAETWRKSGQLEAARAIASQALESRDVEERNRARALLGRVDLALGNHEMATTSLSSTAHEAWRLGRESDALSDLFALAFAQITGKLDLGGAAETLKVAEERARYVPEARAKWHYYFALLERARGEHWSARAELMQAQRECDRLGLVTVRQAAQIELAAIDSALGNFGPSLTSLRNVIAQNEHSTPCELGPLYSNWSWTGMLASERGFTVPDLDEGLRRALELNRTCGNVHNMRVDRLNLGLRAITTGNVAGARSHLNALDNLGAHLSAHLQPWRDELRGHLALAEAHPENAIEHFERESASAHAMGDPEGQLRGWIGVGDALSRLGRPEQALTAYESAARIVTTASSRLPVGLPREGYLGVRDGAIARLLRAFEGRGRADAAFDAGVNVYRQTFMRELGWAQNGAAHVDIQNYLRVQAENAREAEADWRLSVQELKIVADIRAERLEKAAVATDTASQVLPSPRHSHAEPSRRGLNDEMGMFIFPGRGVWHVLTRFRGQTSMSSVTRGFYSTRVPDGSWLLPLELPAASGLERIALMPYGAANSLDWSSLVGDPEGPELVFRLGLALRPNELKRPRSALVVLDPSSDLEQARAEADLWTRHLAVDKKWVLVGDAAALPRVQEALNEVDLFYYAGHGEPLDLLGMAGLPLAQGARLLSRDVLGLRSAPRWVVLAGCHTASTDHEDGGAWGLAQAFVVAGSLQVIGSTRAVNDRVSSLLAKTLFDGLRDEQEFDLVRLLNRAERQPSAGPELRGSFRAFAP